MSTTRVVVFLRFLLILFVSISVIIVTLWIIQEQTGALTPFLNSVEQVLADLSSVMSKSVMTGISIGMIVLAVLVIFIPLMLKGIIKKQYLVAVRRGVIAAVVFYFSQLLYLWAETRGRSWLILMMIIVLVISFLVIELLARMLKESNESSFRTDLTASFAAGLASGIVIKLIEVLIRPN